jgi:hypothetical protein
VAIGTLKKHFPVGKILKLAQCQSKSACYRSQKFYCHTQKFLVGSPLIDSVGIFHIRGTIEKVSDRLDFEPENT